MTTQQLSGFAIDESFGTLTCLSELLSDETFVARHNDPTDAYHLDFNEPEIIWRELLLERDVVHLSILSPWILFNAIRAVNTGWGFQPNPDAVFGCCWTAVDMIGIWVTIMVRSHQHK